MTSIDPYDGTITGRDPITKTMIDTFVVGHPGLTDEQLCERIRNAGRSIGADLSDLITPQIVAYRRAKSTPGITVNQQPR